MKCDLPREELIGYLYDEVDINKKAGIESHITACPSCTQALEELGRARNLMHAWPDEEPPASLVFAPEKLPWWKGMIPGWRSSGTLRRYAPGLSLALAGVVLVMALSNFEADYDGRGGIHLKLRLPWVTVPNPATAVLESPLTRAELIQVQKRSLAMIQELIDEGHHQQRLELGLILDQFALDLESQRRRDLLLVGQGLQEIEGSTESRFMRTEDLLHHLLAVTYAQASPYVRSTTE